MDREVLKMFSLLLSPINPCLVGIAVKYDICDHLFKKPMDATELASIIKTDTKRLSRVLRGLNFIGILKMDENNKFYVTSFGETLLSDGQFSLKNSVKIYSSDPYSSYPQMAHSLETGESAFNLVNGQQYYDLIKKDAEKMKGFTGYLSELENLHFKYIAKACDFNNYKHIVDLGGGFGGFMRYILSESKQAIGVLFELDHVIKNVDKSFLDEFGKRCVLISGDFFQSIPSNGDCYVLQKIIWNWNDEKALQILRNVRKNMNSETKLLIIEQTIESELGVSWDIFLMTIFSGAVRSVDEFKSLFEKADLRLNNVIPVQNTFVTILEISIK